MRMWAARLVVPKAVGGRRLILSHERLGCVPCHLPVQEYRVRIVGYLHGTAGVPRRAAPLPAVALLQVSPDRMSAAALSVAEAAHDERMELCALVAAAVQHH